MAKEKENLEGALRRLEAIAEELNRRDVDVEAGLAKFKEGVELIKFCRSQLQKAENEFNKLRKELETEEESGEQSDGEHKDIPF